MANTDLINHIRRINEEGRERMANDPSIWVSMITEDPDHWADYGITTPEEFDQYLDDCFEKEVRSGNIVEEDPEWVDEYLDRYEEDDTFAMFDPDNPHPEEDH